MKFTAARTNFLLTGQNRSGTYDVVRITELSRDGLSPVLDTSHGLIMRVWHSRTKGFSISSYNIPYIGDIIAVTFKPVSRFNPDEAQYFIIDGSHNSVPVTVEAVVRLLRQAEYESRP